MGRVAGSTILDIAYGLDIRTSDDPYLKRAEECLKIIDQAGNPGSFLVDIVPACTPRHFFFLDSLLIAPSPSEICSRMDARSVVQAQGPRVARCGGTLLHYPLRLCQTINGRWNSQIVFHLSCSPRYHRERRSQLPGRIDQGSRRNNVYWWVDPLISRVTHLTSRTTAGADTVYS